jgi:hypothetical protein
MSSQQTRNQSPELGTLWGIGTTLYGRADKKHHPQYGLTYVTTVWFTIFYLPIFPCYSLRIGKVTTSSTYLVVYSSYKKNFYILETLPIQWRQAARTFLMAWGTIIVVWLLFHIPTRQIQPLRPAAPLSAKPAPGPPANATLQADQHGPGRVACDFNWPAQHKPQSEYEGYIKSCMQNGGTAPAR